ncbi:MAG TPA: GTPase Era [Bacteroidales bacterium]|nr:GTPase Era [Bacteroidales bacterium]HPR58324.1 GTPase Era [Bacteroidales bacterium]HRW97018.1 GTPase Era [Bacteroidales bacterium]
MTHKAGFVSILGLPNVGKSTLMNVLVGEKLSVITNKVQTTRHRIKGIVSGENFQIIFSDTPGIIKPHYKLHEAMMHQVNGAIEDADLVIYIVEPGMKAIDETLETLSKINPENLLLVINKVDTENQSGIQNLVDTWQARLPDSVIIPVSALYGFNTARVMDVIIEKLPEHPAYYAKDELTDKSYRFFVSEIIREKILMLYHKEIPYSVEVVIDEFKEEENITRIRALIYVTRESQRMIIIGKQGKAVKQLGIEARKDIETFLNKKVYLEISVKVDKNWRDSDQALRRFGYEL